MLRLSRKIAFQRTFLLISIDVYIRLGLIRVVVVNENSYKFMQIKNLYYRYYLLLTWRLDILWFFSFVVPTSFK